MDSFRRKASRVKHLNTVHTVDELHKNKLSEIDKIQNELPIKKNKLNSLKKELQKIQKKSKLDIKLMSNLKNQIQELENEINRAEDDTGMLDYVCKVSDVLINYYDMTYGINYNATVEIKDDNSEIDITEIQVSEKQISKKSKPMINMSDKLQSLRLLSQQNRKRKKDIKKRKIIQTTSSSKPITKYLNSNEPSDKNESIINGSILRDKYLNLTGKLIGTDKLKLNKTIICEVCNIEMVFYQLEGMYGCKKCGYFDYISTESEFQNHKEVNNEKQKYPYKKINHLKEKLNQFQSKESADIPERICTIIRSDLRRRKIRTIDCIPADIKATLKKHRLTAYYEHLQQIYCKITGSNPITLPREIEDTIISMFQSMQDSFKKHCPPTRSNFLSYSYVLNKCFRILGLPEHAKYFNLLKSKEKLREQDIIWSKICKDKGWPFHPSS